MFKLNDGPNIKLVKVFKSAGVGLSLVCSLSFGVQLLFFFRSGISVVESPGFIIRCFVASSSLIYHRSYP